jgi:protein-tyrosine phosphatase
MDGDDRSIPAEVPLPPGSPHVTHALEDLPEDARARVAGIVSAIPSPTLRKRVFNDLEDAAADVYGNLERVPLLRFLSDYPVPSYTYRISAVMARGERPGRPKLIDLSRRQQYQATVNLCAENTAGDRFIIEKAGLAGELRTYHIPIVDMEAPKPAQVVEFLDLLTGPAAPLTYVHCEAGRCRTGVMTACYRMAVMGWNISDALTEARNFGCFIPGQLAFIQKFGTMLAEGSQARAGGQGFQVRAPGQLPSGYELGRYPLRPTGSVRATQQQLATTVGSVALAEQGQIE